MNFNFECIKNYFSALFTVNFLKKMRGNQLMQIKFIENFNINLNFADNFHENSRMALRNNRDFI